MAETRYYRYLKTNSLRRIMATIKARRILRLKAKRHRTERTNVSHPYPWARIVQYEGRGYDLNYLSLNHGHLTQKALKVLFENGLIDAPLSEMDIFIGSGPIGRGLADLKNDPSLADLEYVATLEEYPLRQEGEANEFTDKVREVFAEDKLGTLGFEPASLDMVNILPVKTWREIAKSRGSLGKRYREQLENWKVWVQSLENRIVREAALAALPEEIQSARQYVRAGRNTWVLTREGDF